GELPNRDPKAPKARLQKWPFFEILKNRPLLGVFGNTKTEPNPEDFFPIDLDVANGGDIKEVGGGKSDRKIPVPENPLKIDDKKRASTSLITPENFIQAELMVQLLFASFDFYQENKYEKTSTNNERGRMIISYEDQALAKNMEQALLHWTPELSAAFIKMNQTGKYDLEFKRLLPKLADERAQRDSKLNAKLSLYALVNRTKMNPESASAEQAIRSLGQPKDLLLILDSIENRKKTPSTEINKMEILDKVLVKQIYELLPTSPELRIDLEPKDK
ncbi:MAG: hypothetical protein JNK65_06455, partial [Deltaproteobacteria bacterium]|nr:hypothetical protein [Deltaproteobacteria bacterium]